MKKRVSRPAALYYNLLVLWGHQAIPLGVVFLITKILDLSCVGINSRMFPTIPRVRPTKVPWVCKPSMG